MCSQFGNILYICRYLFIYALLFIYRVKLLNNEHIGSAEFLLYSEVNIYKYIGTGDEKRDPCVINNRACCSALSRITAM